MYYWYPRWRRHDKYVIYVSVDHICKKGRLAITVILVSPQEEAWVGSLAPAGEPSPLASEDCKYRAEIFSSEPCWRIRSVPPEPQTAFLRLRGRWSDWSILHQLRAGGGRLECEEPENTRVRCEQWRGDRIVEREKEREREREREVC